MINNNHHPPTQTTTPWTRVTALNHTAGDFVELDSPRRPKLTSSKSIRNLPVSIENYINNFEKTNAAVPPAPPPAPPVHARGPRPFGPPAPPPPPPPPPPLGYKNRHLHKGCYISYTNTKWKLQLRKEVFKIDRKKKHFIYG